MFDDDVGDDVGDKVIDFVDRLDIIVADFSVYQRFINSKNPFSTSLVLAWVTALSPAVVRARDRFSPNENFFKNITVSRMLQIF